MAATAPALHGPPAAATAPMPVDSPGKAPAAAAGQGASALLEAATLRMSDILRNEGRIRSRLEMQACRFAALERHATEDVGVPQPPSPDLATPAPEASERPVDAGGATVPAAREILGEVRALQQDYDQSMAAFSEDITRLVAYLSRRRPSCSSYKEPVVADSDELRVCAADECPPVGRAADSPDDLRPLGACPGSPGRAADSEGSGSLVVAASAPAAGEGGGSPIVAPSALVAGEVAEPISGAARPSSPCFGAAGAEDLEAVVRDIVRGLWAPLSRGLVQQVTESMESCVSAVSAIVRNPALRSLAGATPGGAGAAGRAPALVAQDVGALRRDFAALEARIDAQLGHGAWPPPDALEELRGELAQQRRQLLAELRLVAESAEGIADALAMDIGGLRREVGCLREAVAQQPRPPARVPPGAVAAAPPAQRLRPDAAEGACADAVAPPGWPQASAPGAPMP